MSGCAFSNATTASRTGTMLSSPSHAMMRRCTVAAATAAKAYVARTEAPRKMDRTSSPLIGSRSGVGFSLGYLEAGGWRLEAGEWWLVAGGWRLGNGGWWLVAGGWRLVVSG